MQSKQNYSLPFSNKNENFKNMNSVSENHFLALRKKNNEKKFEKLNKHSYKIDDAPWNINISELEPKINNDVLYISFINAKNQHEKLNYLFQMMIHPEKIELLKFALSNMKLFLQSINKKIFAEENLMNEFNEKFFKYIMDLLLAKSNNNIVAWHLSYIIDKLFLLTNNEEMYCNILLENFNTITKTIAKINNNEIKNLLFIITTKIFLGSTQILQKFEIKYPDFPNLVHSELNNLKENFVQNIYFISTIINIFNNMFYFNLFSNYLFNSKDGIEIFNAASIILYLKELLNYSYHSLIFEQLLFCLQNFLYSFISNENLVESENIKKNIQNFLIGLDLGNILIPLIYDENLSKYDIQICSLKILINATWLCDRKFCKSLIKKNICPEIEKLEKFILKQIKITNEKNKIIKLFKVTVDLILNMLNNESGIIIDNLVIETQCIAILFKISENKEFLNKRKKDLVDICDLIISTKEKYVHTKLICDGICEFYKEILKDNPSMEIIEIIVKNFICMFNYNQKLINDKNNIIILHLEKIGVQDLINNFKGREDLNDEVMELINKFLALF